MGLGESRACSLAGGLAGGFDGSLVPAADVSGAGLGNNSNIAVVMTMYLY